MPDELERGPVELPPGNVAQVELGRAISAALENIRDCEAVRRAIDLLDKSVNDEPRDIGVTNDFNILAKYVGANPGVGVPLGFHFDDTSRQIIAERRGPLKNGAHGRCGRCGRSAPAFANEPLGTPRPRNRLTAVLALIDCSVVSSESPMPQLC